jgi:hypothetical protein
MKKKLTAALLTSLLVAALNNAANAQTSQSSAPPSEGLAGVQLPKTECKAITVLTPIPSPIDNELPTNTPTGIFADSLNPVLADNELNKNIATIFIPYQAKGKEKAGEVYSKTLTDGYARLTQIAYRTTKQCPNTRLILLGQGQAGHLVSFMASEIGAGKSIVKDNQVAFAATISDPTRGESQPLFPGAAGQTAPSSWGGSTKTENTNSGSKKHKSNTDEQTTNVTLHADYFTPPEGSGINHKSQQITDFGSLTGRVAQFCLTGDLSCSAPKDAALGRAALAVADQEGADFSKDPVGAANITAQAMSETAATGVVKSLAKDWEGDSLASLKPTGEHSVSDRIEQVASQGIKPTPQVTKKRGSTSGKDDKTDEKPTTQVEDSMQALVRTGSIAMQAVTTIAADVLDEQTIASVLAAGVTGGATSPELATILTAKLGTAALKLVPPSSLGSRATSIFEAVTDGIVDNQNLPELVASARTWDQLTTQDGYKTVPVSSTGESTTTVIADWIKAGVQAGVQRGSTSLGFNSENSTSSTAAKPGGGGSTLTATPSRSAATAGRGSTSLGFNSENSTSSTAAKPKSQTASHQGYIRQQDGSVQEAGKPIQSKDYKLYTVADEGRDPNPDGKTQTIDEASKGLVTENGDLSAAEQLEVLADPEYPNRNSLKELSESGGLVAITHTHGATQ